MATLRLPDVVPSPSEDAQRLRKAFQGLGTDEKAIIDVLGHRSVRQRKDIKEAYFKLYNKSLITSLQSELSGDFMKAIVLWTYDPCERDARLANEALKKKIKGLNELQVIVEISCASNPHHLAAVRQTYCSLFGCSLEEDIVANVSLPVRKILVNLVSSYRYDRAAVDLNTAKSEAAILHESIKLKKLDKDEFLWILCIRNTFQLKQTFLCYEESFGTHIYQDIKKCGSGKLESVLRIVIWCIDSPEKHFAEVIRASIVGFGTDEDSLTRAIVSRAEIDMMKIRGEYYNGNKSSLDNAVIGDTSGDYKNFLMTLLGAKI